MKHTLNHQMKPKIKMPDYYFTQDGMAAHKPAMTMNNFVETRCLFSIKERAQKTSKSTHWLLIPSDFLKNKAASHQLFEPFGKFSPVI